MAAALPEIALGLAPGLAPGLRGGLQQVLLQSLRTGDAEVPLTPADIHVLLVDDEQLSRLVVGNLLRKCNYRGAARAGRAAPRPTRKTSADAAPARFLSSRAQ